MVKTGTKIHGREAPESSLRSEISSRKKRFCRPVSGISPYIIFSEGPAPRGPLSKSSAAQVTVLARGLRGSVPARGALCGRLAVPRQPVERQSKSMRAAKRRAQDQQTPARDCKPAGLDYLLGVHLSEPGAPVVRCPRRAISTRLAGPTGVQASLGVGPDWRRRTAGGRCLYDRSAATLDELAAPAEGNALEVLEDNCCKHRPVIQPAGVSPAVPGAGFNQFELAAPGIHKASTSLRAGGSDSGGPAAGWVLNSVRRRTAIATWSRSKGTPMATHTPTLCHNQKEPVRVG